MTPLAAPERRPPVLPPSVALANRLRPVLQQLARHLRRKAGSGSVTAGQLEILGLVEQRPGVGINELAGLVGIAAPSMSNAVDKLEAAGLAVRSRAAADDRRRVGVTVSEQGARVLRVARTSRNAWLAERLRRLTPEQRGAVEAALDALETIAAERPAG